MREIAWPWRRRLNPEPERLVLAAPVWLPLRSGGEWSEVVRELVRGLAGVYAVRETANPGTVLYVGESHEGRPGRYPERWWKTLKRHFQGQQSFRKRGEWTYSGTHDLEVALWGTPPDKTYEFEGVLIAQLSPLHTRKR